MELISITIYQTYQLGSEGSHLEKFARRKRQARLLS